MPAPSSTDEYLDLVRKSAILDEKKLGHYLDQLGGGRGVPHEPSQLAEALVRDGLLTHFQAEQFLLGKWRRFNIGKYRVLERLGAGGMGNVFLCEHTLMRRRVAVKVLPTARAADPAALERFFREARCVAALDHPNLVHAYDIGQEDKLHFLVLEYVDGASLQEIVKRSGPLNPIRTAHYIAQGAQGLQHAFECAALVHRDVKPGNILVDRQGIVKILDMGLARFFNDEEDVLTKKYDENVLGTADYLAPEQALDSHAVDIRADIYSLGATFYFCLTGRTPFTDGSVAQKLVWHQTRQPKAISTFRSDVPPELIAVIDKMMSKDPADRYSTPQEVVEALASWTHLPIDLPTEVEMPRLSLAATGPAANADSRASGPGSSSRKLAKVGDGGHGSPNKGTAPARKTGTAPSIPVRPQTPVPGSRGISAMPHAAAHAPGHRSAQTAQTSSAGADQLVPWTSRGNEGAAVLAKMAAATAPATSPVAAARQISDEIPLWRRILVVVGAIVVAVALFFLGMMLFSGCASSPGWSVKSDSSSDEDSAAPTIKVSKSEAGAYPSLKKAIQAATPGTHVKIMDPVLEEQFRLQAGDRVTLDFSPPVIVESGTDKPVAWKAPGNADPDDPLLVLEGVKGLEFRNLNLNGDNRLKVGVQMIALCPGVALENVHFQGFTQHEVETISTAGYRDRPIKLVDLHVVSAQPRATSSFAFRVNKEFKQTERTEYFTVHGCRFDGPFGDSPIETVGNIGDLDWRDNVWKSPEGQKTLAEPK